HKILNIIVIFFGFNFSRLRKEKIHIILFLIKFYTFNPFSTSNTIILSGIYIENAAALKIFAAYR
ncbi:MAG TPA: hypothetical protein VLB50_07450, partial [Ignavibacteriaceae bacterium]|nr:hypothetical protein [Ignavibacteriaceae bacterium]